MTLSHMPLFLCKAELEIISIGLKIIYLTYKYVWNFNPSLSIKQPNTTMFDWIIKKVENLRNKLVNFLLFLALNYQIVIFVMFVWTYNIPLCVCVCAHILIKCCLK